MPALALPVHDGLAQSSRVPVLAHQGQRMHAAEMILLASAGILAALATAFLELRLRIPGHAIIRAVFPMAFGLAVAPRYMAGTIMGASALVSAMTINTIGVAAVGVGALTSLSLTGPLLDLALWRARRGWRLYLGFALAGLGANLAAFAVRAGIKLAGLDHAVGRPLAAWWPPAIGTYAVCGVLAGLISAGVWFQLADGRRANAAEDAA